MATTFYYDSVDSLNTTVDDVTYNAAGGGGPTISSSTVLTNEERANDGSITTAVTSWGQNDGLQFNLGSAKAVNFIAIYFNAEETDDVVLVYDSAATGVIVDDVSSSPIEGTFSVGWNITEFNSATYRYWTIIADDANGLVGITEIFLGTKLTLPVEPTASIQQPHDFGTEFAKAYGNNEYVKSNHDVIGTIVLDFEFLTAANVTSIKAFADSVTDRYPFIYSEDAVTGPYRYCRMIQPIQFTEVLANIWSCQITLHELL